MHHLVATPHCRARKGTKEVNQNEQKMQQLYEARLQHFKCSSMAQKGNFFKSLDRIGEDERLYSFMLCVISLWNSLPQSMTMYWLGDWRDWKKSWRTDLQWFLAMMAMYQV